MKTLNLNKRYYLFAWNKELAKGGLNDLIETDDDYESIKYYAEYVTYSRDIYQILDTKTSEITNGTLIEHTEIFDAFGNYECEANRIDWD